MAESLHTSINGQPAEWTQAIWQLWHTYVDVADPKFYEKYGRPTRGNYFTPRPYRNEYDRGSTTEGFTWTTFDKGGNPHVYQTLIRR